MSIPIGNPQLPTWHPYKYAPPQRGVVAPLNFIPTDTTTSLWLDASDVDSYTEVGGFITEWNDKSGKGNDLVQGTGGLQGIISNGAMEYVNGQRFDQSNLVDMLDSSGQFMTIIVHEIIDPTTSVKGFPLILDLQDNDPGSGVDKRRPGFLYVQAAGTLAVHASGAIATDASPPLGLAISGATGNGSNIRIDTNGTTKATTAYTPRTTTALQNFRLGDISIQNLPIRIREVIHVAGPFNQAIYDKLTGYAAWKHGLVDVLNPSSPYKIEPPKAA